MPGRPRREARLVEKAKLTKGLHVLFVINLEVRNTVNCKPLPTPQGSSGPENVHLRHDPTHLFDVQHSLIQNPTPKASVFVYFIRFRPEAASGSGPPGNDAGEVHRDPGKAGGQPGQPAKG